MHIAFAVEQDAGLDSQVFNHFGSAAGFVFVNTETGDFRFVSNKDKDHIHGQCRPTRALDGNEVDAVAVGGIGKGALMKLQAAGITVYRASDGSIAHNLELMQAGSMPVFDHLFVCPGHGPAGGCSH